MKASIDQGKQIFDLFSGSTVDQAQGIIEAGDLVKMLLVAPDLRTVDRDKFSDLLGINPYADENVETSYGYPKGYKPAAIRTQSSVLRQYYPTLDASHVAELAKKLGTAEGSVELYQVVPKLKAMGLILNLSDPYGDDYGKCLEYMLGHIDSTRTFYNYRKGCLTSKHVRLSVKTRQWLQKLEAETPGDYIIVPMQSGKLWAGYSVRNARFQMGEEQIPLPSWVVGHHVLTHPKRETEWEQLHIDCAGDEYSPGADGRFGSALFFGFSVGGLGFVSGWAGSASTRDGSASAFVRE